MEMRVIRATVLAIIAAVAVLDGTVTVANASGGTAAAAACETTTSIDPGDPGLPPDD
jgi:hypothetical protein